MLRRDTSKTTCNFGNNSEESFVEPQKKSEIKNDSSSAFAIDDDEILNISPLKIDSFTLSRTSSIFTFK